jgi:hypothetical protein
MLKEQLKLDITKEINNCIFKWKNYIIRLINIFYSWF